MPMCLSRLDEAFNQTTYLFDRQLRDGVWSTTQGTEHFTSTAISLIGQSRIGEVSDSVNVNQTRALNALIKLARRRQYNEALGLLIWANSVCNGIPLLDLLHKLNIQLDDLPQLMAPIRTSEVAWFVIGLAHELVRTSEKAIAGAIKIAKEILLDRYMKKNRLFYHVTTKAQFIRCIRRHIGNFADQIYSVLAISLASIVTGNGFGVKRAEQCAAQLVSLQGNLGQWCWHYDTRKGEVFQTYPVYSVHQYGMAPMALKALAAAGGMTFKKAVRRGLEWLANNELNKSLVDYEAGTIWRDIEYNESWLKRNTRNFIMLINCKQNINFDRALKFRINYETRPYEWAWCLYAYAMNANIGNESNVHIL